MCIFLCITDYVLTLSTLQIYRSAEVAKQTEDPLHVIDAAFYIPFVLRSLSVLSALRFIFDFSVSGSGLIYAIK